MVDKKTTGRQPKELAPAEPPHGIDPSKPPNCSPHLPFGLEAGRGLISRALAGRAKRLCLLCSAGRNLPSHRLEIVHYNLRNGEHEEKKEGLSTRDLRLEGETVCAVILDNAVDGFWRDAVIPTLCTVRMSTAGGQ